MKLPVSTASACNAHARESPENRVNSAQTRVRAATLAGADDSERGSRGVGDVAGGNDRGVPGVSGRGSARHGRHAGALARALTRATGPGYSAAPGRPVPGDSLFPLRDDNPTLLTPYVTVAIIAINVLVWIYVEGAGFSPDLLNQTICHYGMIPAVVTHETGGHIGVLLGPGYGCRFGGLGWWTVLTSMFMHAGWLHIIGNMWFLWLFGNNVEDSMGHIRYLVFYLLMGAAAAGAQILSSPASPIPTIGASGAISGVMGAYLVLYPRIRIQTLFIIFFFIRIIAVPAWLVLVEWFAVQLLSGAANPRTGGGVAFWAHVGGFVAGALLVKLFENRRLVEARRQAAPPPPTEVPWR